MKQRRLSTVNSDVQKSLVWRATGYWLYCLLIVFTITVIWTALTERTYSSLELFSKVWSAVGVSVIAAACLIPLMIRDLRWFSNRFVGPIERLRGGLHEAAEGKPVRPIQFREDDFWQDVAEDFNAVRERLEQLPKTHESESASVS